MSMLAERKSKQKWCLNPRGKIWSEDSNKFGQKMLEKMGWSNGKGLGANLDGRTEHVKISYKNDSKGMGFKENADQWTEHEDKFSALLNQLGDREEAPTLQNVPKSKSLEMKSQKSRSRVHYHKFTRGKDLSRYSEKDLANILGRKTLQKNTKPLEDSNGDTVDERDGKKFGVDTVEGGSMVDYFKKKMPSFGMGDNEKYKVGANGVLITNNDNGNSVKEEEKPSFENKLNDYSDDENIQCFGFGFKSENDLNKEGPDAAQKPTIDYKILYSGFVKSAPKVDNETSSPTKKSNNLIGTSSDEFQENVDSGKRKSKKKGSSADFQVEDNVSEDKTDIVLMKKKSKKKKERDLLQDEVNYEIIDVENNAEVIVKKRKSENDQEPKKKKIKLDIADAVEECDVITKKKKKTKIVVTDCQDFSEDTTNENRDKKSKKKRKAEKLGIDNSCFNDDATVGENKTNPFEVPRKKKNKKSDELGVDNDNFNGDESLQLDDHPVTENPYEILPKKKKKAKVRNTETVAESLTTNEIKSEEVGIENAGYKGDAEASDQTPVKKKKKKSKKEKGGLENPTFEDGAQEIKEDTGIVNPALNLNDTASDLISSDDLMLNIVSEPIKVVSGLTSTPARTILQTPNSKPRKSKSVRFSEVNEEHIIPSNRENQESFELYDINTNVVENGLEEQRKNGNLAEAGFVNNGFDIRSIDKVSFYESSLETKKKMKNVGVSNVCFNNVQENVEKMSRNLDSYQAEVENDLNEAKHGEIYVGDSSSCLQANENVEGELKLAFSGVQFGPVHSYMRKESNSAKKSYKHLIKGDITLAFKGTNLDEFKGYGKLQKKRIT